DANNKTSVTLFPAEKAGKPLGTAFGVSKDVRMLPGEAKKVNGWMPLPDGAQILAFMGHFHKRGSAYTADLLTPGGTPTNFYGATNEQDLAFTTLVDKNIVTKNGEGVSWTCDLDNRGGTETITWGPDTTRQEHCNAAVYYVPGGGTNNVHIVNDVAGLTF